MNPLETGRLVLVGPVAIARPVVTTWAIMVVVAILVWLATRRLQDRPGPMQLALEGVVEAIEGAIREVLPDHAGAVLPLIATLWIFLVIANLAGVIPGVESPTANLSTAAALALLVFLAVHWYGARTLGLKHYLRHYLRPNPLLLPFHVVSELSRTVALAVRLFGNIMSLELAALLVLLVGGLLVPLPLLLLHIVEALVQAYIFGMLALVYIASAIQTQESSRPARQE